MDPLSVFVLAIWGIGVSWIEERFGAFQNLSPSVKQLINSVLTFIVPAVVNFLTPIWRPELGDASEVVNAALFLVAPVVVWLFSQIGHYTDGWLGKVSGQS